MALKQYYSQSKEPVTKQVGYNPQTKMPVAPVPRFDMQGVQMLAKSGQIIGAIAESMIKIKSNQEFADGVAEYNNLINTFNESLAGQSPDTYMDSFSKVMDEASEISSNYSPAVQQKLDSQFTVWNEANRATTANQMVKAEVAIAKRKVPIDLAEYVQNGQHDLAEEYINNLTETHSPEERELLKWEYDNVYMVNHELLTDIEAVSNNYSPEGEAALKAKIDKLVPDPGERMRFNQMLDNKTGTTQNRQNAATRAFANQQAGSVGESVASGNGIPEGIGEMHPEVMSMVPKLTERIKNNDLNTSTPSSTELFNDANYKILNGKTTMDEADLLSYLAQGVSVDQYNSLKRSVSFMTQSGPMVKNHMREFGREVDDWYRPRIQRVMAKFDEGVHKGAALQALQEKRMNVMMDMKENLTTNDMSYKDARELALGDMSGYVRGEMYDETLPDEAQLGFPKIMEAWGEQFYLFGNYELEDWVEGVGEERKRLDIITELLEADEYTRAESLSKSWYVRE